MTSNEKVLFVAVLVAVGVGVWYYYKNGSLAAAYSNAAAQGLSPS